MTGAGKSSHVQPETKIPNFSASVQHCSCGKTGIFKRLADIE